MARIGFRMRELADIVSAMPGCSRRAALRAAGLPERWASNARPLDRAIRAGLIIQDSGNRWAKSNAYALFANERDQAIFNLRNELLRGQPSQERAEQLVAQIEELRAEAAASWADSGHS
jgi:hypothetical protein